MGFLKSKPRLGGLNLLLILLMMQVFSPIMGCGGKEESASSSSETPDDPDDPDSAPPNVVNNLGFYVKLDEDKFLHKMSKDASFDTACSIPPTATSSQDIICRIDAMEGDFFFHGANINFNVPPEICKYTAVEPSYYYDWEIGRGPKSIELDIFTTGGVNTITSCTVTEEDNVTQTTGCDTTSHLEVTFGTELADMRCRYDHTDDKGPNCCLGKYTLTRNITGETTKVSVEELEWGGKAGACISGPGALSWSDKTSDGFPKTLVYFSEDGVNESWKINDPLGKELGSNLSLANHFGALNHSHNGFVSGTSSTAPYAYAPIDDRDGSLGLTSGFRSLPEYHTLLCMDSSWEIIHRIRLQIREWNTLEGYLAYVTSNGVTANPDTYGLEDGIVCDYTTGLGSDCNDFWDWDDLLNWQDGNPAATTDLYDTIPANVTNRRYWFPMERQN